MKIVEGEVSSKPQEGVELPSTFVEWRQYVTNDWLHVHTRHIGEQKPMGYATTGDVVAFTCPCGALHCCRKGLVPFTQAGINVKGGPQYKVQRAS